MSTETNVPQWARDAAEALIEEYERDTLGDWPRFAADDAVCDCARGNTVRVLAEKFAAHYADENELDADRDAGEGVFSTDWLEIVCDAWSEVEEPMALAIDWTRVAEAIDDGADPAQIRAELEGDDYDGFTDAEWSAAIPVTTTTTLRAVVAAGIPLNSEFGIDDAERDALLDDPDVMRVKRLGERAWIESNDYGGWTDCVRWPTHANGQAERCARDALSRRLLAFAEQAQASQAGG